MSKSYGNTINITDTPDDMYGKCMRIADAMLGSYLDLTTDYEPEVVDGLKARLTQSGTNPMDVKKEVAFSLVRQYYDEATARAAADQFRSLVQEKEIPDEVPELQVPAELQGRPVPWPDLLAALTHEGKPLAASKGEVRRLMAQGAFTSSRSRSAMRRRPMSPGYRSWCAWASGGTSGSASSRPGSARLGNCGLIRPPSSRESARSTVPCRGAAN